MARWAWSLVGCRLILVGMVFGLYGFFLIVLPGEGNTGRLLPAGSAVAS